MTRLGGAAAACATCIWLVLGVAAARARQPDGVPTARAAATLATIIRRDARQQIRRDKPAVTVTKRCCGVRILRVRYKVQATGDVKQASYSESLRTKHGVLRGVAISESSMEAGYSPGRGAWENRQESKFAISSAPPGPNHGWRFIDAYGSTGQGAAGPSGGPQIGLGSFGECRLPMPVPRRLYMEVLLMLGRAHRHMLSEPGRLPPQACVSSTLAT